MVGGQVPPAVSFAPGCFFVDHVQLNCNCEQRSFPNKLPHRRSRLISPGSSRGEVEGGCLAHPPKCENSHVPILIYVYTIPSYCLHLNSLIFTCFFFNQGKLNFNAPQLHLPPKSKQSRPISLDLSRLYSASMSSRSEVS